MKIHHTDFLVIGCGLAGLSFALKASKMGRVTLLSKTRAPQTNTALAQGGIAAVTGPSDHFEKHIQDTMVAGAGLCQAEVLRNVVEQAPDRITDLENWGVQFDIQHDAKTQTPFKDLAHEGGHSHRRVLHIEDHTGKDIHQVLLQKIKDNKNIELIENQFAIDLLVEEETCLGAYVFDAKEGDVSATLSPVTILATGGVGKAYLYTSNWSGATGDGVAMAFRAGAHVTNMEFMQFHPTCLYHPEARNFLITEALRGEGALLINAKGEAFMKKYHPLADLAPRDIVAQSIDAEMKKTRSRCIYLDVRQKPKEEILRKFPVIYARCLELGIDLTKEPIPVVPAAHYLCGGVETNLNGETNIHGLFALGETACTGLHGANRLASNSLLECLAFAHNTFAYLEKNPSLLSLPTLHPTPWQSPHRQEEVDLIAITHIWEEIRRLMWNYVGIVRTNRRLNQAHRRLENLNQEIRDYFHQFKLNTDLLELRNIGIVAQLTVQCALHRKESIGTHYNLDYLETPISKPSPNPI